MAFKIVRQLITTLILSAMTVTAFADTGLLKKFGETPGSVPFQTERRYESADNVFTLSISQEPNTQLLLLHWQIKPGYYLYRDRFSFKSEDDVSLGVPTIPPGISKTEEVIGHYEIFKNEVTIQLPILSGEVDQFNLQINYQGCAEDGYCYPPQQKSAIVNFKTPGATALKGETKNSSTEQMPLQDRLAHLLQTRTLLITIFAFFGLGILLAFTPCVLPMLPILSSIIVGSGEGMTKRQAFIWSSLYVLGMAIAYTIIGVAAALAGHSIQTALQTPWVIITFVVLFVLLALSLFNFYHIRLPHVIEQKLHQVSHSQNTESYIGVTILGALSALVVSPCITPPLIGALAYIGQTGNTLLGGVALFALGLGMGAPLIAVATIGAAWLPAAGPWMDNIKATFGVFMLALAITLLERFWAGPVTLSLWAMLSIISGIYLGAFTITPRGWHRFWQGLGFVLVIYGVIALFGAMMGHSDPMRPLASNLKVAQNNDSTTTRVKTLVELQTQLQFAQQQGQSVVLDYYADWCISCVIMEKTTFKDPAVLAALSNTRWVTVDVTANNAETRSMQQLYKVFAPPTLVFLDSTGGERSELRQVGEIRAKTLVDLLGKL